MSFIIAIDGPTSSGKSTLAKEIANKKGFLNIQTGSMYRCVAKAMYDSNIDINDIDGIKRILESIDIKLENKDGIYRVWLNGKDVTTEIRTKSITDYTSKVASISIVRQSLVEKQRNIAKGKNVVMEGRDIGTNVFPNANLKIFLNASPKVRIQRRMEELKSIGEEFDVNEVAESVYVWDKDAIERKEGGLKKDKDYISIDTSNLSVEQLTDMVIQMIDERYIEESRL